jgi:hypothetical protein
MRYIIHIVFAFFCFQTNAQKTVGLINYKQGNQGGYILFSPMSSTKTFLIDKCGEKIHEWSTSSYRPGLSSYLLEDGSLLRAGIKNNPNFDEGGSGGIIEKFDWNGKLIWSYSISDSNYVQHHDIKMLPNGNILAIVWDRYSKSEAIANGKNSSYTNPYVWSEKIIEIQPEGANGGKIIWEWKLWDHLIQDFDNTKPNYGKVFEHPELVSINYFPGKPTSMDWIHLNSIDYNPTTDQLLVSSHTFNEIWIIDHSTTTIQAASHVGGKSGRGGDLLYRWGNPQSYQRGNPSTKKFFGQHHATWIPEGYPNAGKIIVFNNGLNRTGNYSSIDMIETPINNFGQYNIESNTAFLPNSLFWSYTDSIPSNFYSSNISGVYPLKNGSFMITEGASGNFIEIDSSKQLIWQYVNPISQTGTSKQGDVPSNNLVFRCNFYPEDYPAFEDKNLIQQGEIELNPSASLCESILDIDELIDIEKEVLVFPNPIVDKLSIQISEMNFEWQLFDNLGRKILEGVNQSTIDFSELNHGIYLLSISSSNIDFKTFKINY